jgi:eukaryotic-like serine/threonine-protein kinase
MSAYPTSTRQLQRDALEKIGDGGQGTVYSVTSLPGVVYKEFKWAGGAAPSAAALDELIALLGAMPVEVQDWVDSRTVWPRTSVVDDHGRLAGLTMDLIPDGYFHQLGVRANPRRVLREWNHLSMRESYRGNSNLMVGDLARVDIPTAIELVADLARSLEHLHAQDLIVGDISGRNLLWALEPEPHTVIIDCDGFRKLGTAGVLPPKDSPDWDDPAGGTETCQASDIYKLGLAAYRAVWAATTDRPPADLIHRTPPGGEPLEELAELVLRSVAPTGRPTASDWVREIERSTRFAGRPVVTMNASVQQRPVPSTTLARGPRPMHRVEP